MSATSIVCPSCRVPFTRNGAAGGSSNFYRTQAENDTCIVCREGLDPVTLEPLAPPGETMKQPERMNDGELVEAILIVSARARMNDAGAAFVEQITRPADAR